MRSPRAPSDSSKVWRASSGLLRLGAAPRARRGSVGGEIHCSASGWVCALALAARARCCGREVGWARLARGSLRPGKPLQGGAVWVPPPDWPYIGRRARRWSVVVAKVAARAPGAYGSARLFRARRGDGRRGAGRVHTPASGWLVCTGSRSACAAALGLGRLQRAGQARRGLPGGS